MEYIFVVLRKGCVSLRKLCQEISVEMQINPYILYGGVGAVGVGIVTYLMSSQPASKSYRHTL